MGQKTGKTAIRRPKILNSVVMTCRLQDAMSVHLKAHLKYRGLFYWVVCMVICTAGESIEKAEMKNTS